MGFGQGDKGFVSEKRISLQCYIGEENLERLGVLGFSFFALRGWYLPAFTSADEPRTAAAELLPERLRFFMDWKIKTL